MQKTVIGILATTLVIFIWGYIYWGLSPLPYSALHKTTDDAAAQQALDRHFPESGAYMIPHRDHDEAMAMKLTERGPVGFVHIRHHVSPRENMVKTMILGAVLTLVIVALLAGFFHVAKAREFRDFTWLSMTAGAVAVVAIHVGDMVWWQMAVGWKFWMLLYDFSVWIIAGHLLGIFMKEDDRSQPSVASPSAPGTEPGTE